jgi:hypothetical protein
MKPVKRSQLICTRLRIFSTFLMSIELESYTGWRERHVSLAAAAAPSTSSPNDEDDTGSPGLLDVSHTFDEGDYHDPNSDEESIWESISEDDNGDHDEDLGSEDDEDDGEGRRGGRMRARTRVRWNSVSVGELRC